MGGDVPQFVIFSFFIHCTDIGRRFTVHQFCMDDVGWKRDDDGLKQACWVFAES
jgi:hypothetical protein